MKARARLLALLMAGVVTFGGCGGSSANQTTDENAQASTETKDQAEVTVDGGSTDVSQNEAESNTEESQSAEQIDFEMLKHEVPETWEYTGGNNQAIDLDMWFIECGADDDQIGLASNSQEGGVASVGFFEATFGKWTIDVTTKEEDPDKAHIYIYTPTEKAVIEDDYSADGVRPVYNMTEIDSLVSAKFLDDYLPKLVAYMKTCPDNPVIPYGQDQLPIEKME